MRKTTHQPKNKNDTKKTKVTKVETKKKIEQTQILLVFSDDSRQ